MADFAIRIAGEPIRVNLGPSAEIAERAAQRAEVAATESAAIVASIKVVPFPAEKYDNPRSVLLSGYSSVTTATMDEQGIDIANGQRLRFDQLLSATDMATGDTMRVEFQRPVGTVEPPSFSFYNGASTLVGSAISFTQLGDSFVADGEWPATADRFRIDWTNSSGAAVEITNPRFARLVGDTAATVSDRTRFNSLLASSTASLTNSYGGATGISGTSGTGTGTPVVNADGSVFAPANRIFTILAPNVGPDFAPKTVGEPITLVLKSTAARHNGVNAILVGDVTGTTIVNLQQLENGYWVWQGAIPAISGSTAAVGVRFQIDNRDNGNANYTAVDATVSDFMVVDGLTLPDRVLAPGATTAGVSDESAVSWSKTGTAPNRQVFVYARNASGDKVLRYRLDEKVDAGTALDAFSWAKWDVGNYVAGVWTSERELFASSEVSTAIQTQQAVDETTDSDLFIWGGGTHGQQVFTSLQFLIDGTAYTLGDLPDSGSATGDKFTVIGSGYAYDENTTTTALTGQTQYDIAHGELRKFDTIRYEKTESVGPCYLAMAPVNTADVEEIFVNGTGQKIAAVTTDISSGNQRRPSVAWQGDLGTVVMDAINHDGEIGVLVDNRTTFWKGYFSMNGTHNVKVPKVAGDRQYLLTSYRHYS